MRLFLLMLLIALPLAVTAQDLTSPTLRQSPQILARIGARQITAVEAELTQEEVARGRRRVSADQLEAWKTKARRHKVGDLVVKAAVQHYIQAKGLQPTEAEINEWVKSVRALGDENRRRDIAKYEGELKAREAELAAATDPEQKKSLAEDVAKRQATLKALHEAFKMDEALAQHYPNMGANFLGNWKSRKALLEEFGGSVYEVGGTVEPLDAMEALVKKLEADGVLIYDDPSAKEATTAYFARKSEFRALDTQEGTRRITEKTW